MTNRKSKPLTLIEQAIDQAVRCVKCGAKRGECNCWTQCKCGWVYAKGGKCTNPIHPHFTDDDLINIVTEFTRGLLGKSSPEGMSFMVCAALEGYLNFLGVETVLIRAYIDTGDLEENEFVHFILILPDERIIDPTATELKNVGEPMPEVYMGALPEWYRIENKAVTTK